MRYRGFNVEYQMLGKGKKYYCAVFASDDDLRKNALLEFTDDAEGLGSVEGQIQNTVDSFYDDLVSTQRCNEQARYLEMLGRAVTVISEEQSTEELYQTLTDNIGLTDDEIRKIGFTNLAPFFDRDGYAQTIAEYIIDQGTAETMSGNYVIPFSEINKRFGINLLIDEEMLHKIIDSFDSEVVSDVEADRGEFDMMFHEEFCPNYYKNIAMEWG